MPAALPATIAQSSPLVIVTLASAAVAPSAARALDGGFRDRLATVLGKQPGLAREVLAGRRADAAADIAGAEPIAASPEAGSPPGAAAPVDRLAPVVADAFASTSLSEAPVPILPHSQQASQQTAPKAKSVEAGASGRSAPKQASAVLVPARVSTAADKPAADDTVPPAQSMPTPQVPPTTVAAIAPAAQPLPAPQMPAVPGAAPSAQSPSAPQMPAGVADFAPVSQRSAVPEPQPAAATLAKPSGPPSRRHATPDTQTPTRPVVPDASAKRPEPAAAPMSGAASQPECAAAPPLVASPHSSISPAMGGSSHASPAPDAAAVVAPRCDIADAGASDRPTQASDSGKPEEPASSDGTARPSGPGVANPPSAGPQAASVPPGADLPTLTAAGVQAGGSTAVATGAAPARSRTADARPVPPAPAQQLVAPLLALSHGPTGHQNVTVRLDPATLGAVQIRIERAENASAQVEVKVERPETLTLLLRDTPQLHRALDQAGIPVEGRSLTFHLATPEAPVTGGSAGNQTTAQTGAHTGSQTPSGPQSHAQSGGSGGSGRGRQPRVVTVDASAGTAPSDAVSRWRRVGLDIMA